MHKLSTAGVAALLTLGAGQSALADDTEILSTTTTAARLNRPNTLFIADTSGSMGATITTEEIYDPNQTYTGACDANYVYFTTDGTSPPTCAGNQDWFDFGDLVCEQGLQSLNGGGRYSDIMAQYYSASGGPVKWDELSPMNNNFMVECARDDGEHGDGGPELYAKRGSSGQPFTTDPTEAVFWGAQPTEVVYYLYSGNFLNYFENPPISGQTRISVLRDVLDNFYNTLQDTNAGLMRFNGGNGGRIIEAIEDLDAGTHRQDLINAVAGLPSAGVTPLSETLYESAQYWTGRPLQFPSAANTDADALDGAGNYVAPTSFECTNNYQILLSDGAPVSDTATPPLVDTLPSWATLTGNGGLFCTGVETANGACMDDMAAYLAPPDDTDTALIDAKKLAGVPDVTTYTIGFQLTDANAIARMEETAQRGKGQYFPSNSLFDLIRALEEIQDLEAARETTFTSPSVSVNSFNRTRTLDDLYFTVFEASTQTHWPGNLKRYKLDNNGEIVDALGNPAVAATGLFAEGTRSFWTPAGVNDGAIVAAGGAASQLPPVATRRVFTNFDGGPINTLVEVESATFTPADLGISGIPGDPTVAELVEWINGEDLRDIDSDPTTTLRQQIGDPLHSQPASIVYGGTPTNPEGLIIFGTNDGLIHAIDMQTGAEVWSFMPLEFLDEQNSLFKNQSIRYKNYGVDGNMLPIIFDENQDGIIGGNDFIYLAFGMRRGDQSYYLLDITNKATPTLKWRLTPTELDSLGWTWSTPVAARVRAPSLGQDVDSQQIALFVGGGYDTVHDVIDPPNADDGEGARIFMIDLESGKLLWAAGNAAVPGATVSTVVDRNGAEMNRAIPAELSVVDVSGDGYIDRIYAGDMGGQLLRFDITNELNGATFEAAGGVIAQLGSEGAAGGGGAPLSETRRFYTTPDPVLIRDPVSGQRFLALMIGSGYRASPLSSANNDRFYSIRDADIFNTLNQSQFDSYNIVTEGDLAVVDRTSNAGVVVNAGQRGWLLPLETGEKILSNSGTFLGTTFFASFTPNATNINPCIASGGLNRLYRINPADASPPVLDANQPPSVDQRFIDLTQSGIVADPVFLFGDKDQVVEVIPPRPPGCPAQLSDKECVCLADPSNSICAAASCEDDPNTANAVVCLANYCTALPACLRPTRTIWTQEGVE
ncbi:MAG: hypothetical protein AAFX44_04200 [Pseudomonadota bacterium]